MARVLVKKEQPETVRRDVIEFRRRYQKLHFVR